MSARNIIIVILLFNNINFFSQQNKNMEIFMGYGIYESLNTGIKCNFHNHIKIGLACGYEKYNLNNSNYKCIITEFDIPVMKNHVAYKKNHKWHINNKILYWQIKDDYYIWDVLAIIPAVSRSFYMSKSLYISIDAGPAINVVLKNTRKTFRMVGWPHHTQFNCNIRLNYLLWQ